MTELLGFANHFFTLQNSPFAVTTYRTADLRRLFKLATAIILPRILCCALPAPNPPSSADNLLVAVVAQPSHRVANVIQL